MTEFVTGLTIGLAAGISPGPLQALVVTASLERGFGAGWRIAVAPLLTDLPIIAASVVALSAVPGTALNWLAVAGGTAVAALGVWSLRAGRRDDDAHTSKGGTSGDVWRGVLVNVMSPHPWGFWFAAGGPILVAGWRRGPWLAVAFLGGFYGLLIGSKVALAWVIGRTRHRLHLRWRRRLVFASGLLLVAAGVVVAVQGGLGRFG